MPGYPPFAKSAKSRAPICIDGAGEIKALATRRTEKRTEGTDLIYHIAWVHPARPLQIGRDFHSPLVTSDLDGKI